VNVAAYSGPFGQREATRLLWRAGRGPRPGDAARYAALGLNGAVDSLLANTKDKLVGSAPKDGRKAITPKTTQPLILDQNELCRKYALGSFKDLLLAVTANPAMLLWLSGALVNFGQDPHNLVLKRGSKEVTSVLVPSGQRAQLQVTLKPGRYELYCSLLDHQALGMDTELLVKQKKRR
jgi:hypothetical protein